MIPLLVAYALLALFFVLEGRLREGGEAKTLEASQSDRDSTRWLGRAYLVAALALLLAPLLNYLGLGVLLGIGYLAWLGIFLMLAGIGLRVWANRTLGAFYTRTLRTAQQQQLIRQGPYRIVRHPGYLGMILTWVGAALATANWLAIAVIVLVIIAAYYFRIGAEERMLRDTFGEAYAQYRARTWKLIPFLF
jgi:protein-S-isoprenylcysteine O-methyltransferase